MTDVQLLEKAARAAGLPWDKWVSDGDASWNPLVDDGDALRLAVDMALSIEFGNDGADYTVVWDGCFGSGKFHHHQSDRRNATRWAIVTIAAQADPKTPNARLTCPQGREEKHE